MTTTPDGFFPENPHTVIVREAKTGKLLGRLTPDGATTNRVVYAVMLSKERAEQVAAEINAGGEFTTKVRPF